MPTYKDSSGKWFYKCYYTDYLGEKRQKLKRGFSTKREAQTAEREFLERQSFQPDMLFGVFYDMYLQDVSPTLRQHSLQVKSYRFKKIEPAFFHIPINKITAQTVRAWHNSLIASGFSSRYIKALHSELSAVFNHACRFYGLGLNPCKQTGQPQTPAQAQEKKNIDYWTLEQFRAVYAEITDVKAKTAIALLYWTGMRKGELFALTWDKVDKEAGTITIDRSFQRLNGEDVITPTKTGESRTIKLPASLLKQLEEYKARLYDPSGFVIPWGKNFIEKAIQVASERAGVPRLHVHGLRHSHASLLISQGVNIVLISKRLGHKNVSMTLDVYSHFFPEDETELTKQLDKLVSN